MKSRRAVIGPIDDLKFNIREALAGVLEVLEEPAKV